MVGVYGPRQSQRRQAYSEQGRLSCDVKLATFATRQRGTFGQVNNGRRIWVQGNLLLM
jgi:ribonuclease PH